MRVAALYDIHGNRSALDAVLEEVAREQVDRLVIGGDVLPGPMPCESMDMLLGLAIAVKFIMGNGDREVLARVRGIETDWYRNVRDEVRQPIDWTADQLGSKYADFISTWPATLSLPIEGLAEVLFCHATPRNDTDIFTRITSTERLEPVFAGLKESTVVCGHTHMQFDLTVGMTRVLNAGSVGMPFGRTGADWLLLGPDVQFRHTEYDLEQAAVRIRQTKYPDAHDFVRKYVLSTPSEEQIVQAFAHAELK